MQVDGYAICGVTGVERVQHNSCMAKKKADPVARECGRRIKRCRGELTQRDVAAATGWTGEPGRGLSPNRIAMYERGERRVDLETAQLFSKAFPKFPPAYFMGAVDEHEGALLVLMRSQRQELAKQSI